MGDVRFGRYKPTKKTQILAIATRKLQDTVARATTWWLTLNRDTARQHVPCCLLAYIAVCPPRHTATHLVGTVVKLAGKTPWMRSTLSWRHYLHKNWCFENMFGVVFSWAIHISWSNAVYLCVFICMSTTMAQIITAACRLVILHAQTYNELSAHTKTKSVGSKSPNKKASRVLQPMGCLFYVFQFYSFVCLLQLLIFSIQAWCSVSVNSVFKTTASRLLLAVISVIC